MNAAVVDASVAVKWTIQEDHSDRALGILRHVPRLHAPAHWLAEAGTALWAKTAIHHLISAPEMHERLAFLASLPIATTPLPDLIFEAGMIALGLHLTIYDTLYLALAEKLAVPLVTADRKLFERAGNESRFTARICWIGEMDAQPGR